MITLFSVVHITVFRILEPSCSVNPWFYMVSIDTKPCILVVMHFTIDPDYVVPDSRRFVREDMIVVDCLFSETSGLLVCSKNNEARRTILENLKNHAKVWNAPSCLSYTVYQTIHRPMGIIVLLNKIKYTDLKYYKATAALCMHVK